jgi:hypothetical protein
VTGYLSCTECTGTVRAFWWWIDGEHRVPLCDGHAASRDLDELTEIGRWTDG